MIDRQVGRQVDRYSNTDSNLSKKIIISNSKPHSTVKKNFKSLFFLNKVMILDTPERYLAVITS